MIATIEAMLREKTIWSMECASNEFYISISNIVSVGDMTDVVKLVGGRDRLSVHIEFNGKETIENLLSGKDHYFKLEKIAVCSDKTIKVYFSTDNYLLYYFELDRSVLESFEATLWKGTTIMTLTKVAVYENNDIIVERKW